jgi:uncharacterized protein YqgC (DUF456 family)
MTIGSIYIEPEILYRVFALTIMLVGLLTLAVPILPGLVIIWLGAFVYGLAAGFDTLGWVMFAIMTVLMAAGSFVDNILMGTQAHREGAPWWSVLVALVAAIAGNFAMPIVGGVLAALLALFLVEWIRRRDARKALTATRGMLVGCGWAVLIRVIIGLVMIGLWLIWAWG